MTLSITVYYGGRGEILYRKFQCLHIQRRLLLPSLTSPPFSPFPSLSSIPLPFLPLPFSPLPFLSPLFSSFHLSFPPLSSSPLPFSSLSSSLLPFFPLLFLSFPFLSLPLPFTSYFLQWRGHTLYSDTHLITVHRKSHTL